IVFTYHTKFDVDIARAVGEGFLMKETIRAMISNISACDEVWTVSKGAGENLRSLGYEGEYRVMNNGVDFARGKASEEAVKEAVKDYDLPENVPVFLYVGRIMNYKGLPLILDALGILSGENFDFHMLFVGGGADLDALRNAAEEKGLADKVFFTGPVHDREVLRAINTRADLFLFPSTYDTNGIVVREAAACGLASVLIDGSCAAEGITDGRNGYLLEETPEAMASLLSRICKDMDAVRTCGDRAMEEIYISWEDSVKCAYERYGEIREMIMDGRLTRRKPHLSDLFIEQTAEIEEKLAKVFEASSNIREGMMENVESVKDNVKKNLHRVEHVGRTIRGSVMQGAETLFGRDGGEDV
ncbi:MAG: glycosyltransferase, partial [Lachnospiraceae bacterium]|nr:glycosyltransferase [Lachnospiraceae bacterium]